MRARSVHRKPPGSCSAVAKASAFAKAMADKSDKPEGKAEGNEGKHYVPPEIGFRAVKEDAGGRTRRRLPDGVGHRGTDAVNMRSPSQRAQPEGLAKVRNIAGTFQHFKANLSGRR